LQSGLEVGGRLARVARCRRILWNMRQNITQWWVVCCWLLLPLKS